MKVWCHDGILSVTDDGLYIKIDDENGVLRLSDYGATGSHTTSMLFLGPNAGENAEKFDTFINSGCSEIDVNEIRFVLCNKTESIIKKCFGLS